MREEDTVCVGSDGLKYCKVCGEAKEAFFPKGGFMGMKKHSRQCACDRKVYEEEQKYFKDKEHRELVSRNTSICFDESRMEEWTFENADMSDTVMHRAKKYVDNWEEMKRNHIGCLFWGPVGTGKSFIAGCIANELLKQEVMVKMTNFNTDRSNTDLINLSDSSEQQSMDLMEEMELFQMNTALVKRNIEYDCLVQRCRLGEQQQLDEIVALIVETISIERENITISGVKYPYQFVKSRLLLLEESHIEYVLDCLHENTREVKNIKAYLLTCLMNSITTIGNYYQAKVNHDMYGGGI